MKGLVKTKRMNIEDGEIQRVASGSLCICLFYLIWREHNKNKIPNVICERSQNPGGGPIVYAGISTSGSRVSIT